MEEKNGQLEKILSGEIVDKTPEEIRIETAPEKVKEIHDSFIADCQRILDDEKYAEIHDKIREQMEMANKNKEEALMEIAEIA